MIIINFFSRTRKSQLLWQEVEKIWEGWKRVSSSLTSVSVTLSWMWPNEAGLQTSTQQRFGYFVSASRSHFDCTFSQASRLSTTSQTIFHPAVPLISYHDLKCFRAQPVLVVSAPKHQRRWSFRNELQRQCTEVQQSHGQQEVYIKERGWLKAIAEERTAVPSYVMEIVTIPLWHQNNTRGKMQE